MLICNDLSFSLVAYYYRDRILPKIPYFKNRYQRVPAYFSTSSFQQDIDDGLTSEAFDLQQNVEDGDSRAGLENSEEIKRIMEEEGVNFDQARLIRQQRKFKSSNIDPLTGIPKDPKFVSF
ncbi:9410_t:CDS:1 [Paraglomus brasilianum]|uniref:9410_t:CDS:1 n=1 Tax=Paraglomus brasilianum TaxID=144538 RepID=A0A9N8ZJ73_9GLOM|nr:9410_t:CDS:1 [Paraglomus brasilianum]